MYIIFQNLGSQNNKTLFSSLELRNTECESWKNFIYRQRNASQKHHLLLRVAEQLGGQEFTRTQAIRNPVCFSTSEFGVVE